MSNNVSEIVSNLRECATQLESGDLVIDSVAMARAFAEMDSEGQAAFFDELHRIVMNEWESGMGSFRVQKGQILRRVSPGGKEIMQAIGEVE
jgi:hypothetical protein